MFHKTEENALFFEDTLVAEGVNQYITLGYAKCIALYNNKIKYAEYKPPFRRFELSLGGIIPITKIYASLFNGVLMVIFKNHLKWMYYSIDITARGEKKIKGEYIENLHKIQQIGNTVVMNNLRIINGNICKIKNMNEYVITHKYVQHIKDKQMLLNYCGELKYVSYKNVHMISDNYFLIYKKKLYTLNTSKDYVLYDYKFDFTGVVSKTDTDIYIFKAKKRNYYVDKYQYNREYWVDNYEINRKITETLIFD